MKTLAITLIAALCLTVASASAQTLTSDQPDYEPGSTATLTGTGFAPGETVTLQVLHADGTPNSGTDHEPWTAVASGSGQLVTTWHVCTDDCLGSQLRATAVGSTSGLQAAALFTDNVAVTVNWYTVNGTMYSPTQPSVVTSLPFTITANITYSASVTATTTAGLFWHDPGAVFVIFCGGSFPVNTTVPSGTGLTATVSVTYPAGLEGCVCDVAAGREFVVRVRNPALPEPTIVRPILPISFQVCSPIEVIAPAALLVHCASEVPAADANQASATGGSGTLTIVVIDTNNGGLGTIASPLIITRTYKATDAQGGSGTATQTITVASGPPALTLPSDVTATTGPGTEACNLVHVAVATGTATATDNCGPPTITVSGIPAGNLFPVGDTPILWTATNGTGGSTSGTQHVIVSCPVGSVVGSAELICNHVTTPAANVSVRLLFEGNTFRTTTTNGTGQYRFDDVRRGTYTVAVDSPSGYAATFDTRVVTIDQPEVQTPMFDFTCQLSDLAGRVMGTCNGQTAGLYGVTVDVFRTDGLGQDHLVATTATDVQGNFVFDADHMDRLALGSYTVGIVLPLGYSGSSSQAVTLSVADGSVTLPNFALTCQAITSQALSMGYWKHQVDVYLTGKGHAQETLASLVGYIGLMVEHFNQNLINPVMVYVPGATGTNDKLLQLQQLMTINKGGTMLDRAKQQLLPLLLNVVSGKISQTQVISGNGATVSQAITYSYDLIVDGNPANDETAKTVCDLINNGQSVPAGMVPSSVRQIAYRLVPDAGAAFRLDGVRPNPARSQADVSFSLLGSQPAMLEVIDLAGRSIRRQDVSYLGSGPHTLRLGGGPALPAGVYLVRLIQGDRQATARFVVVGQ